MSFDPNNMEEEVTVTVGALFNLAHEMAEHFWPSVHRVASYQEAEAVMGAWLKEEVAQ